MRMSAGGGGVGFLRDKDNTENCSNPDRTLLISFSLFFISCSGLDISESPDVVLWILYYPQFLSEGVVLPCVCSWASRQFLLFPLVSVNRRGLFSRPLGGWRDSFFLTITVTDFSPFSFLTIWPHSALVLVRSNALQRMSFFNYFSFLFFSFPNSDTQSVALNSCFLSPSVWKLDD